MRKVQKLDEIEIIILMELVEVLNFFFSSFILKVDKCEIIEFLWFPNTTIWTQIYLFSSNRM